MAVITKQELEDAAVDVQTIFDVTNGAVDRPNPGNPSGTVTSRLGKLIKTLSKAIFDLDVFNYRGAWVTATNYALKDVVAEGGLAYVCILAHISGVFATDLAAGKWAIHQGATREELASPDGSGLIGFQQAGTGAVAETVEDEIRRISVTPQQFGAVADGVTDDYPAFALAVAYLKDQAFNADSNSQGSQQLFIPAGDYYISETIELKFTCRVRGEGTGQAGGYVSRIKAAANIAHFIVQSYNTTGSGVESPTTTGAAGTIFEGLVLQGAFNGTRDPQKSCIWLRARATIRDCILTGSAGHGVYALASQGSGGATEGNVNGWRIDNVLASGNAMSGAWFQGADANAGLATAIDCESNGDYGFVENAFLGNLWVAMQSATNGTPNAGYNGGTRSSVCIFGGRRYFVMPGKAAAASTSQPGDDPTVWQDYGPANSYPAWVNGNTYSEGGAYLSVSLNNHSQFMGYTEGDQAPAFVASLSQSSGPQFAGYATGQVGNALDNAALDGGGLSSSGGFYMRRLQPDGSSLRTIWGIASDGVHYSHGVVGADSFTMHNIAGDYVGKIDNLDVLYLMSAFNTALKFNRAAAVHGVFQIPQLAIGDGFLARIVGFATASPVTSGCAVGEIRWNAAAAVGQPKGWVCTVQGAPDTWVSMGNL